MLDLPEPFRPVMALKNGSKLGTTVRWAYDLKPSTTISSINMAPWRTGARAGSAAARRGTRRERGGALWPARRSDGSRSTHRCARRVRAAPEGRETATRRAVAALRSSATTRASGGARKQSKVCVVPTVQKKDDTDGMFRGHNRLAGGWHQRAGTRAQGCVAAREIRAAAATQPRVSATAAASRCTAAEQWPRKVFRRHTWPQQSSTRKVGRGTSGRAPTTACERFALTER